MMDESIFSLLVGLIAGVIVGIPMLFFVNFLERIAFRARANEMSFSQYLLLYTLPQRLYAKFFPHQLHRLVAKELNSLGWSWAWWSLNIKSNFIFELRKHFLEISGNDDPVSVARRDKIVDCMYGHFWGEKTIGDVPDLCRELGVCIELLPDNQLAIDLPAKGPLDQEFEALRYQDPENGAHKC